MFPSCQLGFRRNHSTETLLGVYKYFFGFSGFSGAEEVYKYEFNMNEWMKYFSGGVYKYFSGVYKYFSGAGEVYKYLSGMVYVNTSPAAPDSLAPDKCINTSPVWCI